MGYFYSGLPPYMLAWAAQSLPTGTGAVETGTYLGDSAAQIASVMGAHLAHHAKAFGLPS